MKRSAIWSKLPVDPIASLILAVATEAKFVREIFTGGKVILDSGL